MRRFLPFIIIFLLLFPIVFPLFTPLVRGTADGLAHKFRVVSFVRSLREGTLKPRWLADQAMGYGSPMFLFNYLVPYYAIGAFILAGVTVNTATQIYIALAIVLSGFTMYLLARQLWGSKAGIAAAIAYAAAPYHLLAAYVYEGWGEVTAFVFPPIILYLTLKFTMLQFHNATKPMGSLEHWRIGSLWNFVALCSAWFLFILSHNPSVVMFTPIILIATVYLSKRNIRVAVIPLGAFVIALMLTAFFWLPAISLNHLTNYPTLIAIEAMMRATFFKSKEMIVTSAIDTIRKGNVGFRDFTVGLPILISIVGTLSNLSFLSYLKFKKKKQVGERSIVVVGLLLIFFGSLYLASFSSYWLWDGFKPLNYIVYPFRFLFPATLAGSLLVGYIARKYILVTVLFVIISIVASIPFTRPTVDVYSFSNDYFYQPQTIVYAPGTKMNMATVEFLPKSANREYLQSMENDYITTRNLGEKFIFADDVEIIDQTLRGESLSLTYEATKNQLLTINTHAFPNWEAKLDGGKHATHNDLQGRITTSVPAGRHTLSLQFGKLPIEKIAYGISTVAMVSLGIVLLACVGKRRNLHG